MQLHVLHLDVLRRQIEIETESKNKNFRMYGYNAGPAMAIRIYTVLPYCVIASIKVVFISYSSNHVCRHMYVRMCIFFFCSNRFCVHIGVLYWILIGL